MSLNRTRQQLLVLDSARRSLDPVASALVDSVADGRVGRRDFLRRGAIVGLSAPMLGLVAQACSSEQPATPAPVDTARREQDAALVRSTHLVVGIAPGDANSGLDPVNMAEAGTFSVVSQCFEYLVGTDATGAVAATGLAESWSSDAEGSTWTFVLRSGPRWSNGSPLMATDAAATIERLIAAGNSALADVIAQGSVEAPDDRTVVVNLAEPNGNLPVLLSASNPQSVITPADYSSGTTLDRRPEGTGPWLLESFDAPAFVALFRRNPNWWGPTTALETLELRGVASSTDALAALRDREIDVVAQVLAMDTPDLSNDPALSIIATATSAHRQLWFNTSTGIFSDVRLRRAVAWATQRTDALTEIAGGYGVVGNDHPIRRDLGSMPFYETVAIGQRFHDIDRASGLIDDAAGARSSTVLHTNDRPDAQALAAIVARNVEQAGLRVEVLSESSETFYRDTWCPTGAGGSACPGSADFGVIEYEHQALPDAVLGRGFASGGVWNASNYSNPDLDRLFRQYRRSIDLEDQRRAIGQMQTILWTDVPAVVPYFDDVLTVHHAAIAGLQVLPTGQPVLSGASWI